MLSCQSNQPAEQRCEYRSYPYAPLREQLRNCTINRSRARIAIDHTRGATAVVVNQIFRTQRNRRRQSSSAHKLQSYVAIRNMKENPKRICEIEKLLKHTSGASIHIPPFLMVSFNFEKVHGEKSVLLKYLVRTSIMSLSPSRPFFFFQNTASPCATG